LRVLDDLPGALNFGGIIGAVGTSFLLVDGLIEIGIAAGFGDRVLGLAAGNSFSLLKSNTLGSLGFKVHTILPNISFVTNR